MPRVDRNVLKGFFPSGGKPSAAQFSTLVDSVFNFAEDTSLLGLNNFDATLGYNTGDTVVSNKIIYQANKPTSPGPFNFADWDKIAGGTSGLQYKGNWDANANVPDLVHATPSAGDYYIVSVAGNTNLNGITDWGVGDWAISNGTNWAKIDSSENVKDAISLGAGIAIFKQKLSDILQFLSATSVDGSVKLTGGSDTLDMAIQFDDANTAPNRAWSAFQINQQLGTKEPANPNIQAHIADMNNPHDVTKEQLGLHFVQNIRVNYTATTDPGASDDSTQSYSVGSMWINTTTSAFFICVDATAGAAVWKDEGEITGGQNTGTGVGIYKTRAGSLMQFLSLLSSNGSLQLTPSTDSIDLSIAFGDGGTSPTQAWSAFQINQQLGTKEPANPNIQAHIVNFSNPHLVTAAQVGLGNVQNIKDNFKSNVDPNSSNDSSQGYSTGSRWINAITFKEFVCLSPNVGNAVWRETTSYFGNDYLEIESNTVIQTAVVAPAFANYNYPPATPSGTFKLSTGTRSGTYKISWSCLVGTGSKAGQFQLKNITSGTPQVLGTVQVQGDNTSDIFPVAWTGNVQLTGVNQDFVIQFNTSSAAQPVTIYQARLEIFRVS